MIPEHAVRIKDRAAAHPGAWYGGLPNPNVARSATGRTDWESSTNILSVFIDNRKKK
jgi:hypothetical protein